jgi:hypothetical protein
MRDSLMNLKLYKERITSKDFSQYLIVLHAEQVLHKFHSEIKGAYSLKVSAYTLLLSHYRPLHPCYYWGGGESMEGL